MYCCTIFRLAYILSMLVAWGRCDPFTVCNDFPDIFQSQRVTIACDKDKTGIHIVHNSLITYSLTRGSCQDFPAVSLRDPVECTVYAGKDDNVDPEKNPTFTALSSYGNRYNLSQDGVHSWTMEKKKKHYEFSQTWTWPVKYTIYIHNFRKKGWVYVYCKFDKLNGIQKTLYPNQEKGHYSTDDKPLTFGVNMSPEEDNEIPCQVEWEGRASKYGRRRYSFFALNKRQFHSNTLLIREHRSVTVGWYFKDDGVYLWLPGEPGNDKEIKVESWREAEDKTLPESASKVKTNKRFNLRGWKFSERKTKYRTLQWNTKTSEYCSAYNLKTLYCPPNSDNLCPGIKRQ